ncbi:hypothetical protein [Alysiella crassa]|uniref:hypothetical protein n=1 Tax=Alysiella crassa TaxID=153491 RepID=UPI0036722511
MKRTQASRDAVKQDAALLPVADFSIVLCLTDLPFVQLLFEPLSICLLISPLAA